jgi:hypothetical protein
VDVGSILPPRSIEDLLGERVRLVIGGQEFVLPVPVISVAERWKADLDATMTRLLDGASSDDPGATLDALASDAGPFLDLLASFDVDGVLPTADVIRETTTPLGLLLAVLEVWRAVNPLVDIGLGVWAMTATRSASPQPMSAWRPSTVGPSVPSGTN